MEIKRNKIIFNPKKEHNIDYPVRLVIKDEISKEFVHFQVINSGEKYKVNTDEIIKNHRMFRYKYQKKEDKKWVDHIDYEFFYDEEENKEGIKYIYYPPINKKCDKLIFIFQGIKEVGRKNYYNYIKTLAHIDAHKIYVKDDYGEDELTHTSYYLGPNKSFVIADKVTSFIEKKRKKLKIKRENVICAGSSKGGFASLYFGYKLGYGYVISGGPQIRLGTYLTKGNIDGDQLGILPPIMKYLTGSITKENIDWVDHVLYKVLKNSKYDPQVYLHVGKNEPHYEYHVKYFMDWASEENKQNIHLDLANYDTHRDLAKHFPDFLLNSLNKILH